jgi:hypothetical protein
MCSKVEGLCVEAPCRSEPTASIFQTEGQATEEVSGKDPDNGDDMCL